MNRLLLTLIFSLVLLGFPNAHARNGATAFDAKALTQDEYVSAYNDSTGTLYRDYIVGVDVGGSGAGSVAAPGINPNVNLGAYINEDTTSTTDSIYVFGVVDENIPSGQLGRICIRGPHKVVMGSKNHTFQNGGPGLGSAQGAIAVGVSVSQCANNVTIGSNGANGGQLVNGGVGCTYSTLAGTTGGSLGYILSSTATTDNGDVGQASNAQAQGTSTNNEYWVFVQPQLLR